jgi:SAM-dependent methyltransferase
MQIHPGAGRTGNMLLNKIEYWAMNNPVRGYVQRHYEAPRLQRLAHPGVKHVLEIGCGQGTGARIIYELFGPERYVGVDLDPSMIQRARKRSGGLPNVTFLQGDVSNLDFPDGSFDLVVDFGIVHHVPNWNDALAEVHRLLAVDGEFLFEDLSVETWERGIGIPFKKITDHPSTTSGDEPGRSPERARVLESPCLEIHDRLADFFCGVHHERSVTGDGFIQRLAADQDELRGIVTLY